MASTKHVSVTDFLGELDDDRRDQVLALREIITSLDAPLSEHIKWNAPSYVLDGEDRLTMNLRNKEGAVKLVLHMGAVRPENKKGQPVLADDGGIVEWASDIRGLITFAGVDDIRENQAVLRRVLVGWLALDHRAPAV
ncbi:DUF1801 domain-containing protein [Microcella sp.]|uniref:DUF1801 domain-containing protein n=1 Tax=Microcella sp. TaxID=1913979 RepID=UPI002566ED24|nr:DUF1801 domain-containing protein [Microcella sp.]MBX9471674.1 DUF1801 domain-containing protein [Microcella sp.]